MTSPRTFLAFFVSALVCLVPVACGGARSEPNTTVVEPEPPKPRDAAPIADAVAEARIGSLVFVDRVRSHPIAPQLVAMSDAGELLEGTGIDLLRDARRVYVASTGITRDDRAVVVVQHGLDVKQVRSALDTLIKRSVPPGAWLEGTKVPAARVTVRGHTRIVGLPADDFVVVLPDDVASHLDDFAGPLLLPEPTGSEAAISDIREPSQALRGRHVPRVPPTLKSAHAGLTLGADGSADLSVDALSTNEDQARADADQLTRSIDDATSMKISILRVRFFKPIPFRAEGDHVKTDVHLTPDEVQKLLGMAEMMRRRHGD